VLNFALFASLEQDPSMVFWLAKNVSMLNFALFASLEQDPSMVFWLAKNPSKYGVVASEESVNKICVE